MPSPAEPLLLLATRSNDKAREIRQIIAPFTTTRVITLADAGIAPSADEDAVERYDTFLENAHAKAAYFLQLSGITTIADDSGICVDALGGAPGVHSRRFAADSGLTGVALDRANNARLLRELSGIPHAQRGAHYSCAAALHTAAGTRIAALGTCSGFILDTPRGDNGFGYDPLFLDPQSGLSFGETNPHQKNLKSHRARAFRALATQL